MKAAGAIKTKRGVPLAKKRGAPLAKQRGAPLAKKRGAPPKRARRTHDLSTRVALGSAEAAPNSVLAAAVLLTLGAVMSYYSPGVSDFVQLGQGILAGLLWLLFVDARRDPSKAWLPTAVALALYAPLVVATYVTNPLLWFTPGTVVTLLVIGGLSSGIRASLRYRDLVQQAEREALTV